GGSMSRTTVYATLSLLALLTARTASAQSLNYTFEGLAPGALNGQQGWSASGDAILAGTGVDTTNVFGSASPAVNGDATHVNDGFFGFGPLTGAGLILGFDFRVVDASAPTSGAVIILAKAGTPVFDPGSLALEYAFSSDSIIGEDRLL